MEVPFSDPYSALVDLLGAAEANSTAPEDDHLCDQDRLAVVRYGRALTGAAVMRAENVRVALRTQLDMVMESYDLLVMATVPDEPFAADAIAPPWAAKPDDLLWLAWSPAAYPFNLTGQPALSLPVGITSAGLPVGLQLVGRRGDDELVLATGEPHRGRARPQDHAAQLEMKRGIVMTFKAMVTAQRRKRRRTALVRDRVRNLGRPAGRGRRAGRDAAGRGRFRAGRVL